MKYLNKELETKWNEGRAKNTDPYSAAMYDYAERWADLMESRIELHNEKLADIAESISHDADTEGITGFMYGCAVSILSKVWIYGEELRQWNNLHLQVKNEGEIANKKSGAVLNPAIICMYIQE